MRAHLEYKVAAMPVNAEPIGSERDAIRKHLNGFRHRPTAC